MDGDEAASQDLCVSCGICCGGALFYHGEIWPEEEQRARELGFTIQEVSGKRHFLLPCGNLCGSVCQIYEERLKTCRDYKCLTLDALEAGEIDRTEANRRVEAGKAAIDRIRKRLLPGEGFLDLRKRFGDEPSPAPDFQLDMVQWQMLMDRYFRQPFQRVVHSAPAAQEPIAPPAVSAAPCTVRTITPAGGARPPRSPRLRSTG